MSTHYTPNRLSPTISLEHAFSGTLAPVLIGNSFPLPLVHRPVIITPRKLSDLKNLAAEHPVRSYWGHTNTIPAASNLLGRDLTPHTERPALRLNRDGLPTLEGEAFTEIWVLSPVLPEGYRAPEWQPVPLYEIKGWNVLQLAFNITT